MFILDDFDGEEARCTSFLLLDLEVTEFWHKVVGYAPVIFCLRCVARILKDEGGDLA